MLGTNHKHDEGRHRCVYLQKIYSEPDAYVIDWSRLHRVFEPAGSPVLRCRRNCFDLAESENDASRATGIIRLNVGQMTSEFASGPPTCLANAWPHTQLLASDAVGMLFCT